jgi:hypothetical protein
MKKIINFVICLILICTLIGCKNSNDNSHDLESKYSLDFENTTKGETEIMNHNLFLKINNKEIDVTWLDNDSIKDLKKIAKDGLLINMHKYGNFEQVGSLGTTIKSDDTRINTIPGDIVLYQSNQIVIFYGSNEWAYTKLGHINLSIDELRELLANSDVNVTISLK